MLIALDLVRAGVALALPFVTEIWQIYLLIALLQSASAGFTPLFQSVIPEILPDERGYTRALSLSRLEYDLESLLSPMLAAAGAMVSALAAGSITWQMQNGSIQLPLLLSLWVVMGMAYAGLVTPGGRLLRRPAKSEDLPFRPITLTGGSMAATP